MTGPPAAPLGLGTTKTIIHNETEFLQRYRPVFLTSVFRREESRPLTLLLPGELPVIMWRRRPNDRGGEQLEGTLRSAGGGEEPPDPSEGVTLHSTGRYRRSPSLKAQTPQVSVEKT